MADADRRFDRSAITIEHASARGRVLRNADNFTRGSQLIGHQYSMFTAGLRFPFLIWITIFVMTYWVMMSAIMGEHEIQLCSWRLGSTLWTWMDFDKLKPMNIVLTDGSIRRTSMGYIPYLPDVQIAWAKAIKAILGSLGASILLAFPAVTWFVNIAQRRGKAVLQERHERGATLVKMPVLMEDVVAHNEREFAKASTKLFPGLTPDQVKALPFADRKKAGLHHPYTLADIPFPYNLEASHTVIVGTTGAGKTTQMRNIVAEMRRRQDSAVIFDLTGAFVEAFYDPQTDIILNPGDARCPNWSIFEDCTTKAEFTAASHAIVPNDGGNADPFWVTAARGLFVQMCLKLQSMGQTSNRAMAENLYHAALKRVNALLKDTSAAPYVATESARMAESVRSVLNTNADAMLDLPDDGDVFSIRDWIRKPDKPGSILFVTARHVDLPLYKMLLTLWLDIAVNTLMTLPRSTQLRTWFMFDELGALHRLPAIENGLQTARGFGGAMVLGLHSFARLQAVYGKEGAENLTSLARTKLILATADRKTAEQCAEFIGHREVRQMDEAYAYGSNNLRDASTLTPKKEIAPLVIPDDITNLPTLHGFIKFPDGFPAARIELKWRDYPQVANGFEPRTAPKRPSKPVILINDADDEDSEEGEGRKRAADKQPGNAPEAKPEQGKSRAKAKQSAVVDTRANKREVLAEKQPTGTTEQEIAAQRFADNFTPNAVGPASNAPLPSDARNLSAEPEPNQDEPSVQSSNTDPETSAHDMRAVADAAQRAERNEEHRQNIIKNELGTDFGDEAGPAAPEEGIEM